MPRTKKANAETMADLTAASAPEPKPSTPKRKVKDTMEKKVLIQYGGDEWNVADLEEKAIAAYVAEGHRRGRITKLAVYIKPEERKIYYAVNDKTTGSTDFE